MAGKRVPIGSLVTIGQRWQRKSRYRDQRGIVEVTQVHRGDRAVEVFVYHGWGGMRCGTRMTIKFPELREKYRLVEQ